MIESFQRTKRGNTGLVVYVDEADSRIAEYKKLDLQQYIEYGPFSYQAAIANYFSTEKYPGREFYQEIHDDHIFITEGWDVELMRTITEHGGWGVCGANDTIQTNFSDPGRNPGAAMISGNIIQALGYWFLPCLRSFRIDNAFMEILLPLGLIYHREDIVIDHVCWHDGRRGFGARAPLDQISKWQYIDREEQDRATQEIEYWRATGKANDMERLKQALASDRK